MILEGESLLNDATALLVYRLAVSATMGATFTGTGAAILSLAMIASAVRGLPAAHIGMLRLTERITDMPSAIILQFVTTFGVWILAEELGLSPIVTLVAFAITAARITPQRTPAELAHPVLCGVGDGGVRAQRAGLRAHRPAAAAHLRRARCPPSACTTCRSRPPCSAW